MGRVRACSAGRYPRFTPAPIRQPRPSVAQRSGKRRHLRQQVPEMLSVSLLLGKRRIPPVARLHREAGGAQGARSIRIAQGTVNKLGGGALRGPARVRAALLRSVGPRPSPPPAHNQAPLPASLTIRGSGSFPRPPAGVWGRLPTPGTREVPAQRAAAAAAAAAGGSRSATGPGADHEDPPTTAPRAPPACLAHTHRLAPYRARGAAPISPTSVNWPFPPSGKGGAD